MKFARVFLLALVAFVAFASVSANTAAADEKECEGKLHSFNLLSRLLFSMFTFIVISVD